MKWTKIKWLYSEKCEYLSKDRKYYIVYDRHNKNWKLYNNLNDDNNSLSFKTLREAKRYCEVE